MPLPKPENNEKQNDFMSRCISFVKNEDKNISNSVLETFINKCKRLCE